MKGPSIIKTERSSRGDLIGTYPDLIRRLQSENLKATFGREYSISRNLDTRKYSNLKNSRYLEHTLNGSFIVFRHTTPSVGQVFLWTDASRITSLTNEVESTGFWLTYPWAEM